MVSLNWLLPNQYITFIFGRDPLNRRKKDGDFNNKSPSEVKGAVVTFDNLMIMLSEYTAQRMCQRIH